MFVKFEDVYGKEVWVNRERINWVKEYRRQNTVISFDEDNTVSVKVPPAQVVEVLSRGGGFAASH
jgi:hypothetical protein